MRYKRNFWENVVKTPYCWEWAGSKQAEGYGRFNLHAGVRMLAHRVSWILTHGKIQAGLCVLHKCDNPGCVRPDHLFLGTRTDNDKDRDNKGRTKMGQQLPQTKLTFAEVQAILKSDETQTALAKRYGVNQSTISLIKNRKMRVFA